MAEGGNCRRRRPLSWLLRFGVQDPFAGAALFRAMSGLRPRHLELQRCLLRWPGQIWKGRRLRRGEPLFKLKTPKGHFRRTAQMMKKDLERAGIPYRDAEGLFADFHSNRHTFITNLARAKVAPKLAQDLARHSTINLTMNTYTHLGLLERSEAVNSFPAPPKASGDDAGATDSPADSTDPSESAKTDGCGQATVVPKMVPSEADWCPESCQSLAGKRPRWHGMARRGDRGRSRTRRTAMFVSPKMRRSSAPSGKGWHRLATAPALAMRRHARRDSNP